MQIPILPEKPVFPDPNLADAEGLVGISLDMKTERLTAAYRAGIFPWYEMHDCVFWYSPDPRMVLFPEELKVQKSMRPYFNQKKFTVTFDTDFRSVMEQCAKVPRGPENTSWISENFIDAYTKLHEKGLAHSVEVWQEKKLVGGLYGVSLGTVFFGESMFSTEKNASKFGFISLVKWLQKRNFKMVDCQVYTAHLASLGAREISRNDFLKLLSKTQNASDIQAKWNYSED